MDTQTPQPAPASTARKLGLLPKVLLAIALIIAALLLVIAVQPNEFRVVRTGTINAPPQAVFEHVNDFRKWEAWSPWAKLDPDAKNTFEGPESGQGAKFRWEGNEDVGEGQMTILESKPGELVRINLEFIKPFPATCTTDFSFKPEGEGTEVTWDMKGQNNFISKAMHLVMDMDKMIGTNFEKGLAAMKAAVEGMPPPQSP